MSLPVLAPLAFFNIVMAALAVTPNLGLSQEVSSALHFTVAAVDMAALTLITRRPLASAAVLAAAMAAVEVLQSAIPGRSASAEDLGLDAAGLAAGWAVAAVVLSARRALASRVVDRPAAGRAV